MPHHKSRLEVTSSFLASLNRPGMSQSSNTAVSTEMTVQMAVTMGIAGAQPNALHHHPACTITIAALVWHHQADTCMQTYMQIRQSLCSERCGAGRAASAGQHALLSLAPDKVCPAAQGDEADEKYAHCCRAEPNTEWVPCEAVGQF